MTRALSLLLLTAACAAPTAPTVETRGERVSTVGTVSAPSPVVRVAAPHVRPSTASRSRVTSVRATGMHLSSTAYCETGLMANGHRTWRGAVAGNRWRLGTKLRVSDSPYGPGVFVVSDRIGHGSQLDFAMPGDCAGARQWGRRQVRVEVVAG